MADQQQRSEALYILGGVAVIGLVAYLSTRQGGNTLQLTQPPAQPTSTALQSGLPTATHNMAFDMTALPDPLFSTPSNSTAFADSGQSAGGQYVELPGGTTVPFMPGINYALGSILHFADGNVQVL